MIGSASRTLTKATPVRLAIRPPPSSRRAISFGPPSKKPRTWRNSAARWGLALGALYYINTSDLLAEQASFLKERLPELRHDVENLQTLDSLAAARRERHQAFATTGPPAPSTRGLSPSTSGTAYRTASPPEPASPRSRSDPSPPVQQPPDPGEPQALEEEAEGEGAFNPETGEINWECPCLGGMAHGPCGDQFKQAFSCFVYSKEETKGIDCIEHFKTMQDCFRAHPDVYAAELSDDPDDDEALAAPMDDGPAAPPSSSPSQAPPSGPTGPEPAPARHTGDTSQDKLPGANVTSTPSASPTSLSSSTGIPSSAASETQAKDEQTKRERASEATRQVQKQHGSAETAEGDTAVPKAWHDGREAGAKASGS